MGNLEQIYDEHAQAIFAFLLSLTRDEADTRDLLQEIFVRLARQPHLLDKARDPRAFLLRLAHNMAIDLMRRRTTREKNQDSAAAEGVLIFSPVNDPDEQSFQTALNEAMANLPPEQRAIVHLKLWQALTFEEIAETLGISSNTAASRYRYGIDKLRDLLRPLYDEIK